MPLTDKVENLDIQRFESCTTGIQIALNQGFNTMNMINIAFVQAERNMTLTEVFSVGSCVPNLTCGAAEKLAVTKFLLALTTAAIRPKTRREIEALDNAEVARKVSSYLSENRSLFEMDGDNAFLQYSESEKAKPNPIEAFIPGLVAGNRGVIRSTEVLTKVTPADIARALLFAVILPFTGKKTDAHVWIDSSGQGKKKGFFTPALGMGGLVHTFVLGHTLLDTLRLNLVAEEELIGTPFTAGLGIAPWEKKPTENNAAADDLQYRAEKAPDFNPGMRGASLYDWGYENLQVQALQCETQ